MVFMFSDSSYPYTQCLSESLYHIFTLLPVADSVCVCVCVCVFVCLCCYEANLFFSASLLNVGDV